jgi:hypothetical protein
MSLHLWYLILNIARTAILVVFFFYLITTIPVGPWTKARKTGMIVTMVLLALNMASLIMSLWPKAD